MRAPFVALLLTGCQSQIFEITVETDASTIVEAGTVFEALLSDFGFGDWVSMDITAAQELKNQGVAPGDIDGVTLTSFVIDATAPAGADLSFLDSMQVSVEAPDLPKVLIASGDNFAAGDPSVALAIEPVDLTDYVVSQALTITTDVSGRRPDQDTDVRASLSLVIGVTAQGALNAASEQ